MYIIMNKVNNQFIKLCIPYIVGNINVNFIKEKFEMLSIGKINRIDIIRNKNYNTIFIWFSKWFENDLACRILKQLQNGNEFNIVYEFPWFWKVRLCYY